MDHDKFKFIFFLSICLVGNLDFLNREREYNYGWTEKIYEYGSKEIKFEEFSNSLWKFLTECHSFGTDNHTMYMTNVTHSPRDKLRNKKKKMNTIEMIMWHVSELNVLIKLYSFPQNTKKLINQHLPSPAHPSGYM